MPSKIFAWKTTTTRSPYIPYYSTNEYKKQSINFQKSTRLHSLSFYTCITFFRFTRKTSHLLIQRVFLPRFHLIEDVLCIEFTRVEIEKWCTRVSVFPKACRDILKHARIYLHSFITRVLSKNCLHAEFPFFYMRVLHASFKAQLLYSASPSDSEVGSRSTPIKRGRFVSQSISM